MTNRRAMGWHEGRSTYGHGAVPKSQRAPRMAPPSEIEAILRDLIERGVIAPGSTL